MGKVLRSGACAFVTGAAGGLGSAFAKLLKEREMQVIGGDLREPKDKSYFDEFIELDVRDSKALEKAALAYKPDLFINNAGILSEGLFHEVDEDQIRNTIDVNLLGVINGTRAAYNIMKEIGHGHIINIGSLAGYNPTYGLSVYSATKFAVRGYTHAVASELAKTEIALTVVCPDGIWTDMLKNSIGSTVNFMPFSGRHMLQPEEVVRHVLKASNAHRLTVSLPKSRAVLARLAGEFPILGVLSLGYARKIGRRNQKRYEHLI